MSDQRSVRPARHVPRDDNLAASLSRLEDLQDRRELRLDLPSGENWQRCSDLLEDPAHFEIWCKSLGEWLIEEYGEAPRRTTVGYIMSWYLHVPAYIGALLFHHERRVPSLRPEELAFRLSGDRPHPAGLAVLGDDFYCLPSDPGSGLPEATVVADERALAAVLRARYIAHAAQFVRAYGPFSKLGRRMLWAAATDAIDNSLWSAGMQGETREAEGAGVADAAMVLESRFPPLTSASTLRITTDSAGRREWTRRRESCCFSYLLAAESECDSCPRTCPKP
ncbi:MAG: hypothetical protein QOI21_590 [Actinomycetota bacterium]|nr:hypothetical protein [Actinomycetota bacterium]